MKQSLYIPVFAFTLLLSATLIFSIQPMFSKMILPLLGGTSQVWNTAMLFFQACLLGGYAYAHGTSKFLGIRTQAILHVILLAIFVVVLPFGIPEAWRSPEEHNPTLWQLSLMASTVGGPFFVLAASAPMFQRWFAATSHPHADNPYFLYGASNFGSVLGLLSYPFIVEPILSLSEQANSWMFGYFAMIGFTIACGILVWSTHGHKDQKAAGNDVVISWATRGWWLLLAFIPSSLMLGVTTLITTDIASVPLLWILPLTIYVGSFILVFARKPLLNFEQINKYFAVMMVILTILVISSYGTVYPPILTIGIHLTVFFFAAMLCHTALVDARPHASRLTEFYLLMSVGGALGGVFNALIAPQFFVIPVEYMGVLILALFIRNYKEDGQGLKEVWNKFKTSIKDTGLNTFLNFKGLGIFLILVTCFFAIHAPERYMLYMAAFVAASILIMFEKNRVLFALGAMAVFSIFPLGFDWGFKTFKSIMHQERNFFGIIKVVNMNDGQRILLHGTTNHGSQALDEEHRLMPLSYYSYESPINDVISYYDNKRGDQRFAVIGLGIGVTACFQKDERFYDFYEIDPAVADVAENPEYFTFLKDCGSPYEIILGDGRIKIEEKPESHYDFILGDAFSSDNIPVHIMTKEAIELYLSKLKPDGTFIMNIANNYLDLEPVVAAIAEEIDATALAKVKKDGTIEGTELEYYPTHFAVITKNENVIKYLKDNGWGEALETRKVRAWTDQYSNIFSVLGNETAQIRYKMTYGAEEEATEEENSNKEE